MVDRLYWLAPIGWYHLVIFGVFVPYLSIRSYGKIKGAPQLLPDRVRHFRSTAVLLVLFGGLSILTAHLQQVDLFAADWLAIVKASPAALLMYMATVAFMRPHWRKAVEAKKPIVKLFMPSNATERVWWVLVSTLAGISEEITWRGMQPMVVAAAIGSALPHGALVAVLLSAASFGLAHTIQGWKSAGIIAVFSLGFQALVWLSGSLYLAMAVHVAYDITAGLTYAKLGRAAQRAESTLT